MGKKKSSRKSSKSSSRSKSKSSSRSKKSKSTSAKVAKAVGKGSWIVLKGVGKGLAWTAKKSGKAIAKGVKSAKAKRQEKKQKQVQVKKEKQKQEIKQKAQKRFGNAKYQDVQIKKSVSGEFTDFEERLNLDSLIVALCGKRGSGKSSLGFALMENINAQTQRPCFVLGVDNDHLPSWIESVEDINDVKNDGVVLVDEGAISFSSRASMSKTNKELANLLAIARHKNMTLILVTQNTGMLDKNVLNLCDTILLKQGSLLQSEMERPVIKKLYKRADPHLKSLKGMKKKAGVYVVDSDFEGLIAVDLPSFWSTNLSKNRK